jgi:TctA family transporter
VPLTEVAFKFGPAEYFSLMVLGLIGAIVLASGSILKAVGMILLGLLMGLVGTDVNSGVARFSFDIPGADRRHRLHRHRYGRVRLRRDHQQPGQARE